MNMFINAYNNTYDFVLDRNKYGSHNYICYVNDCEETIYGNTQCFNKLLDILDDISEETQNSEEFCAFWADIVHRKQDTERWYIQHRTGKYLQLQEDRKRLLSALISWRSVRHGKLYDELCEKGVIRYGTYL